MENITATFEPLVGSPITHLIPPAPEERNAGNSPYAGRPSPDMPITLAEELYDNAIRSLQNVSAVCPETLAQRLGVAPAIAEVVIGRLHDKGYVSGVDKRDYGGVVVSAWRLVTVPARTAPSSTSE